MSRFLPAIATLLFFGVVVFFAAVELINYFHYPTVRQFPMPGGGVLSLYDKGTRFRSADVFLEPAGSIGAPTFVAPFFYAGHNRLGEDRPQAAALWWTADGNGLVATLPDDAIVPPGGVRWFFDRGTGRLYGGYNDPLAITEEEGVLIQERIRSQGGLGSRVAEGYELGRKEGYLPTWRTTRWERARTRG